MICSTSCGTSVRESRRRLDPEGEGAQRGGLTDLRDGEERVAHAHAEETRGSADRGDQPLLGILVTLLAGFAAVEAVEEIEQLSSRVVLGEAQLTACGLSGRERSRTLLGSLTCDLLLTRALCLTLLIPGGEVRDPSHLSVGTPDAVVPVEVLHQKRQVAREAAGCCRVVAANAAHPDRQARLLLDYPAPTFTDDARIGAMRLDQLDQFLIVAPELHGALDAFLDIALRHQCLHASFL